MRETVFYLVLNQQINEPFSLVQPGSHNAFQQSRNMVASIFPHDHIFCTRITHLANHMGCMGVAINMVSDAMKRTYRWVALI